jgi:hypothetical protein
LCPKEILHRIVGLKNTLALNAFRAKPARNQQYWLPAQQEDKS